MANSESATRALSAANLFLAAQRPVPGTNNTAVYFSGKVPAGPTAEPTWILLEITFAPGVQVVKAAVREHVPVQGLANMALLAVQRVLSRA